MSKPKRYSTEVRERAVRMVREHEHDHASQWAAIQSIAEKIGCSAVHPSRGCTQQDLEGTGGAGLFYCFAGS